MAQDTTKVTVIGTGGMGQAISGLLAKAGTSVQTLGRADAATPVEGDVVVLAVPYPAVDEVVAQRGSELAGKVVVDITNPVDFATFDSLVVPADSSATARIAELLPASQVVKAFNTNFAGTLVSGTVGIEPTTVLVAGDDADAKATVVGLVTQAGARALDAGSLARARELEAIGFLQITLAAAQKVTWAGGFAVVD